MSNEGWVKVHRKILESRWIKSPKVLSVFLQCILRANFKDNEVEDEIIKRGEFMTSTDSLSSFTSLTSREVRTALAKLKATNEIAIRTTNKYTIISVCKYEIYQSNEIVNRQAERQAESQANDKQTTNKRQTNDKQTTTTKNEEKDNNDKNEDNVNKEEADLKVSSRSKNAQLKLNELLKHEYFQNSVFSEKWETWCAQKGKKSTAISKAEALGMLSGYTVDECITALIKAIVGNHQGLNPVKNTTATNGNKPTFEVFKTRAQKSQEAMEKALKNYNESEKLPAEASN